MLKTFLIVAGLASSNAFVGPAMTKVGIRAEVKSTVTRMAAADNVDDPRLLEMPKFRPRPRQYRGKAFVARDNIDTDQIIPAEYLTLVPSKTDEYEQLGSYALIGLPQALYPVPYVQPGHTKTEYPIIIAGDNFGCGSSR
ncbi:3-isopropylmalate dehydratase, partial [Nannochloropsis gaditana]